MYELCGASKILGSGFNQYHLRRPDHYFLENPSIIVNHFYLHIVHFFTLSIVPSLRYLFKVIT